MVTWEKISLTDKTFIPQIPQFHDAKSVQLQHYLLLFHCYAKQSEVIVVFDLKENKWLKVRLNGDDFDFRFGSSACFYDNNTIVTFGPSSDPKEDVLSILSFSKGSDCLKTYCSSLNSSPSHRDSHRK